MMAYNNDKVYEKVLFKQQQKAVSDPFADQDNISLDTTESCLTEDIYNTIYVPMNEVGSKFVENNNPSAAHNFIHFNHRKDKSENFAQQQEINILKTPSANNQSEYSDFPIKNHNNGCSKTGLTQRGVYPDQTLPSTIRTPLLKRQSDSSILYTSSPQKNDRYNTNQTKLLNQKYSIIEGVDSLSCINKKYISRSVEELRKVPDDTDEETIYAEIVTNNNISETKTSRLTRESENPILCQAFKQTSLPRNASFSSAKSQNTCNGYYGTVNHSNRADAKNKPIEKLRAKHPYENMTPSDFKIFNFTRDIYENTVSSKNCEKRRHRHSLYDYPEQIQEISELVKNSTDKQKEQLFYENASSPDIYENADEVWNRDRAISRPIDIEQLYSSDVKKELVYSHIDITKTPISPLPGVGSSFSLPSSPRGSTCSSISSELSSPPPLPSARRSMLRLGSWSTFNNYTGQNYYPANYLGRQVVSKLGRETIDFCINQVAQHTNVLEMKPVHTEITNDFLRFGTSASPWELLASFGIEEIVSFEVILKNSFFIGIITGKPREEAYCYVLQSDRCNEIADAIRTVFKTNLANVKLSRSQSEFDVRPRSIQPDCQRFHFLIKIGIIKVKKSSLHVSDYIEMILEKVNLKDFKSVNLEISGVNIIVTDIDSNETEERCCVKHVISVGLYANDQRYFGYIISNSTNKNKMQCHVYRSARNFTASNITETMKACLKPMENLPKRTSNYEKTEPISSTLYQKQISEANRLPSLSTSGYSSASFTSSTSTQDSSPDSFVFTPSTVLNDSLIDVSTSRETLLTPTQRSPTDFMSTNDLGRDISCIDGNIDEPKNNFQEVRSSAVSSPTSDQKQKLKHKNLFGKLRSTLKSKAYRHNDTESFDTLNLTLETGLYHFNVDYICSTVINPPLKPKSVKECYKQYVKEVNKTEKNSKGCDNKYTIGDTVSLQIISNEGVSLLDPNQSNFVTKSFSLQQYDSYATHPEDNQCFAFSTTTPGQNKLKCHLFTCWEENPKDIEKAFKSMFLMKFELS